MLSEREIKIHIDVLSKEEQFVDKARLLSDFEREHIKQYIRSRIGRLQMDKDEIWPVSYTHLTLPTICSV